MQWSEAEEHNLSKLPFPFSSWCHIGQNAFVHIGIILWKSYFEGNKIVGACNEHFIIIIINPPPSSSLLRALITIFPISGGQCPILWTKALLASFSGKKNFCLLKRFFRHFLLQVLQKGSQRSKETLHTDLAHALKLVGRSPMICSGRWWSDHRWFMPAESMSPLWGFRHLCTAPNALMYKCRYLQQKSPQYDIDDESTW